MDVAVVYESLFGNTRLVAEAIADRIRSADPAARVSVTRTDATKLSEVDDACLLVVGGPTHMRRMSSPRSRQQGLQAARKAKDQQSSEPEPGAAGPGLREWLQRFPPPGWAPWPRPLIRVLSPGWPAAPPVRRAAS
jgi:hypothetical protein